MAVCILLIADSNRSETYQDLINEGLKREQARLMSRIDTNSQVDWHAEPCPSTSRFTPIHGPFLLVDETQNVQERNHGHHPDKQRFMFSTAPSINRSSQHPEDCYKFTLRRTSLQ
jgi:hypothetical protein